VSLDRRDCGRGEQHAHADEDAESHSWDVSG
jgi:hypothetical protein